MTTTSLKFWNKNYVLLIIGQIMSLFGNSIIRFALSFYLLDITGSAVIFGSIMAISIIPMIIFTPFGGLLTDRVNKRNIMLFLDIITFGLLLAFGLTLNLGYEVIQVGVVMSFLAIVQSFYGPAVSAAIPSLQEKENLVAANAISSQVLMMSNVLGPILGGLLYAFTGITGLIWIGGSAFFVTAVMDAFMKIPHIKQKFTGNVFNVVMNDLKQGIGFIVKEQPDISKSLGVLSIVNLLAMVVQVGLPVVLLVILAVGSQLFGLFGALSAVAGILGGVFVSLTTGKFKFKLDYYALTFGSTMIVIMGIGFVFSFDNLGIYIFLLACAMLMQFFFPVFNINIISLLQKITPGHLLGKVMACVSTVSMCAIPLGRFMYGYIFERFEDYLSAIFVVSGILLIVTGLAFRVLHIRMAESNNIT